LSGNPRPVTGLPRLAYAAYDLITLGAAVENLDGVQLVFWREVRVTYGHCHALVTHQFPNKEITPTLIGACPVVVGADALCSAYDGDVG
jgi:hypothetical protein